MFSKFSFLFFAFILLYWTFFENSYFSLDLHTLCMNHSPNTAWRFIYQALVCGEKLPQSAQKITLQNIGLIHLFVVSGAHLHLLKYFLDKITKGKVPFFIEVFLLFIFVAICNFQITALRAWIQILLNKGNQVFYLNYSRFQILLLSVLSCLLINPSKITSLSLVLSWGACLGLFSFSSFFLRSFACYLILFPVINAFSYLSPWSVVINAFISPIIACFLFPLTLMSFALSPLVPMTDSLWSACFYLLNFLDMSLNKPQASQSFVQSLPYWFYVLFIHFFMEQLFRKKSL